MRSYTLKHYGLLHKAWEKNPPIHWLKAAELGYQAPEARFKKAVENTQALFSLIKSKE